jgi:hypothetical protein
VALDCSLVGEPGAALTRLGHAAGLVGTIVLVIGISIDGFAGKALADLWADAPAVEEADTLWLVQAVELVHNGLFTIWIFLLFGVTFLLYELAVALSHTYPRWLGWVATLGEAGSAVVGMAMFVSSSASA